MLVHRDLPHRFSATMTSEALMTAVASSPTLSARSSMASLDGGVDGDAVTDVDVNVAGGLALNHLRHRVPMVWI